MTLDQHLWACALALEHQHGEAASLHAAMRVDELEAEGAYEGARTWRQILERIEALEGREVSIIQ